jgi:hypothetical protein
MLMNNFPGQRLIVIRLYESLPAIIALSKVIEFQQFF